jgi:hypothetical protein
MTKKYFSFFYIFCLFAVFVGPELLAEALSVGKVISIKGSPIALRNLQRTPLKMHSPVYEGDILRSGLEEHVTVLLKSGHKVFVLPSTSAKVKVAKTKDTKLEQESGSLWFKVKPLKEKENFQVKTPTAVAGVRGTAFISMIVGDATSLCVCEGTVEISNEKGTAVLEQGFGSMLTKNSDPKNVKNNTNFIRQKRRLSRKPACVSCHWAGEGDSSRLDENSNIIFQ